MINQNNLPIQIVFNPIYFSNYLSKYNHIISHNCIFFPNYRYLKTFVYALCTEY